MVVVVKRWDLWIKEDERDGKINCRGAATYRTFKKMKNHGACECKFKETRITTHIYE